MKDRYDKLMIQYGGSIPFEVLAKEQEKERKELMKESMKESMKENKKNKKRINTRRRKKSSKKRKKKNSFNKSKKIKELKNKCKCNVTEGNNMNNPNALGYCSNCIPEGVMIKGKDGKIYRNKKKEWIKID